MALLEHKGKVGQAIESLEVKGVLQDAARSALHSALERPPAQEAAVAAASKPSARIGSAAKPGLLVAGCVAGITAASAAVSAARRRAQSGG